MQQIVFDCLNPSSYQINFKTRAMKKMSRKSMYQRLINKDRSVMLPVYITLKRPHLEYCVQLWNPVPEHGNWSLILKLEGVQRSFTIMIDGVGLLPYSERLETLKLTTLIERRGRGDLIEVLQGLRRSFQE